MAAGLITLSVGGSDMKTYVATPDGPGPFPGVVVGQGAGGIDSFIQGVCDGLAAEGFAAAAPDLYHRSSAVIDVEDLISLAMDDPRRRAAMPQITGALLDDEIILDMNAAVAHLRSIPSVGDAPIGVTGFCQGGRTTYVVATRNDTMKAVAWFYPPGAFVARGEGQSPFSMSSNIPCPVMGFYGGDDKNPSPDDMARHDQMLNRWGIEHTFHAYEGAAHSFMNDTVPGAYREKAAKDAWPKLVAFLNETLKAAVPA